MLGNITSPWQAASRVNGKGYKVSEAQSSITGTSPTGEPVQATFDERGRLTGIKTNAQS
jgi:hypothetical protein